MNAVTQNLERVTLYYREGSSDKVYQAAIEPADQLFVVNFAYGRCGSTLTSGTKTSSPVSYDTAKKIFAKLVNEKKAKGYTEGEDGIPYQHIDEQPSGIIPQLLNAIEENEVEKLLRDDGYCAQEKFDGRHLLIRKTDDSVEGINKKGLLVGLPETLAKEIRAMSRNFILDGEAIGETCYVFDILQLDGQDLRPSPYLDRLRHLNQLLGDEKQHPSLIRVTTAFTSEAKRRALKGLREEKREGIVFKRLNAPYTPGRPNSGGSQLKFKFVATVSAIVAKINARRSVELCLFQGRSLVSCGNVAIPPNHDIPKAGAIVEVRYLYAYKESLALYQPVYLRLRDDVEAGDCRVSQLKFKSQA